MKITSEDFRNLGFGVGLLGGVPIWIHFVGAAGFVGIIICTLAGGAIGHFVGEVFAKLAGTVGVAKSTSDSSSQLGIRSEYPEDRIGAVAKLGKSRSPRAVISLIAALDDQDNRVRDAARSALVNLTRQDFDLDAAAWRTW